MVTWTRTGEGWAVNLDGTDATSRFALPRLELRSSPEGWQCMCLLADGRSHRIRGAVGSLQAARRTTVEEARAVLGAEYGPALDALLAAR